jgi:hypothetical protein
MTIEDLRIRLLNRRAELNRLHARALERNNPTLHPLAIAIRIEEVDAILAMTTEVVAS